MLSFSQGLFFQQVCSKSSFWFKWLELFLFWYPESSSVPHPLLLVRGRNNNSPFVATLCSPPVSSYDEASNFLVISFSFLALRPTSFFSFNWKVVISPAETTWSNCEYVMNKEWVSYIKQRNLLSYTIKWHIITRKKETLWSNKFKNKFKFTLLPLVSV